MLNDGYIRGLQWVQPQPLLDFRGVFLEFDRFTITKAIEGLGGNL